MSTHYTPFDGSIVRFIQWKRVIFSFLIPLLLVISTISAWVDGVPYAVYVTGATWVYVVILAGQKGGGLRAIQAHAVMAFMYFLTYAIAGVYARGILPDNTDMLLKSLVFGFVVIMVSFHYRIDRLEAPAKKDRAADFPGIYRITCQPNGKHYIGQTSQAINARWSEHRMMLGSRRHHNRWMQADWDMYRPEQFTWEVLEVVTDPVWLLDRERAWQDKDYDATKRYNPPNIAPRIVKASRRPPMKRKPRA